MDLLDDLELSEQVLQAQEKDSSGARQHIFYNADTFITMGIAVAASRSSTSLHNDSQFVALFVQYLCIAFFLYASQLYITSHLLSRKHLVARGFFTAICQVLNVCKQYYSFLLAVVVRDQLDHSLPEDLGNHANAAIIVALAITYYSVRGVMQYVYDRAPVGLSATLLTNKHRSS